RVMGGMCVRARNLVRRMGMGMEKIIWEANNSNDDDSPWMPSRTQGSAGSAARGRSDSSLRARTRSTRGASSAGMCCWGDQDTGREGEKPPDSNPSGCASCLETRSLGLVCDGCGTLVPKDRHLDPFECLHGQALV